MFRLIGSRRDSLPSLRDVSELHSVAEFAPLL